MQGTTADFIPNRLITERMPDEVCGLNIEFNHDLMEIVKATACEVIARRICHKASRDRLTYVMSHRYQIVESDGDLSGKESAMEIAIDSHWFVRSPLVYSNAV
jgi:hypothetical protein